MALVPVADLRHTDGQKCVCLRQVKTRTARKIANPGHPVNSQVPGKNRGADVGASHTRLELEIAVVDPPGAKGLS